MAMSNILGDARVLELLGEVHASKSEYFRLSSSYVKETNDLKTKLKYAEAEVEALRLELVLCQNALTWLFRQSNMPHVHYDARAALGLTPHDEPQDKVLVRKVDRSLEVPKEKADKLMEALEGSGKFVIKWEPKDV